MSIWGQEARTFRQKAVERVIQARFVLGAAAFVTALVHSTQASWWLSFGVLMLVLLAVVVLSATLPRSDAPSASQASDAAVFRLSGQQLAAQLPDPLIIFDHEGTILYVNPSANGAFGPLS